MAIPKTFPFQSQNPTLPQLQKPLPPFPNAYSKPSNSPFVSTDRLSQSYEHCQVEHRGTKLYRQIEEEIIMDLEHRRVEGVTQNDDRRLE